MRETLVTSVVKLLFLLQIPSAGAGFFLASDASDETTFGFSSVGAALSSLKATPGLTFSTQNGWIIVADKSHNTLWSFAPATHPSHPAAVKRTIIRDDKGNLQVKMVVLCEAKKEPCDKLVQEFGVLNERMKEDLTSKATGKDDH